MGFRLIDRGGMIPVSLSNGFLIFEDNALKPIAVPKNLASIVTTMQCNRISNKTIRCFLTNEKYRIIIRSDGSVLVLLQTGYPVMSLPPMSIKLEEYPIGCVSSRHGGFLQRTSYVLDGGSKGQVVTTESGKQYLVFPESDFIAEGLHEDSYYYMFLKTNLNYLQPAFIVSDTKTLNATAGKDKIEVEADNVFKYHTASLLNQEGVIM